MLLVEDLLNHDHWPSPPKKRKTIPVLQESIRLETDDTHWAYGWCKECITPKIHSAKIRCETVSCFSERVSGWVRDRNDC